MERVKILGLAASPRRGNTEILIREALKAAESIGNVETEFVSLVGKKIEPCNAEYQCIKKGTLELPCPSITDDDGNELLRKLFEVDGLIIGVPVYFGTVTAQLKALMDRTMYHGYKALLRNKPVGTVTTAVDRNGGQEFTIYTVITWAMHQDMIPVGTGPERYGPPLSGGGKTGGAAVQGFPNPVSSPTTEGKRAVLEDEVGLISVRNTAKRVAEMAKIVKYGVAAAPEGELPWKGLLTGSGLAIV